MSLPPNTIINLLPYEVEFRTPSGSGVRVVKVILATKVPRILAKTEMFRPEYEAHPMSLSLDEITMYIQEALSRTESPPIIDSVI